MVKKYVTEAIKIGKSFEFEARIITPKGKTKWVFAKGEADMDNGKCVGITGIFQDITERKQSGLLLKESERKFKTIFDNSSVANVIANEKGDYIDVNENACDLLGYSHEELTNMSVREVVAASKSLVASRYKSFKQNGVESGEVELITKSGEIRIAEYFSKKIEDNLYLSTLIDITEKRTQEEELKHIANNLPGVFLRYKINPDRTDELLYISKRAYDLYGVRVEEAMENVQLLWKAIHKDDVDRLAISIQESAEKLTPWEAEYRLSLPEGKIKWVWERGMPQKQKDESVIFHTIALDITEQKKAKESLKESQKQYKSIAESIPGMVLKYKLNADGSDTLLYINEGVQNLYEISPTEAMANNQSLWNRVHPDDVEVYTVTIAESAEHMTPFKFEHRIKFPDSRIKWIDMRGVPEKQDDGSVVWDSIGLDITQRVEAEIELELLNKKLEERVEERAQKAIELSKELEIYWLAAEHAKSGVWRFDVRTNELE